MAGFLAMLGDSTWSDLIAFVDTPSGWPTWWSIMQTVGLACLPMAKHIKSK